jgi:hypothetical protein
MNTFFYQFSRLNLIVQLGISKKNAHRLHGLPDFVKKMVEFFLFTFSIYLSNFFWLFLVVISLTKES